MNEYFKNPQVGKIFSSIAYNLELVKEGNGQILIIFLCNKIFPENWVFHDYVMT